MIHIICIRMKDFMDFERSLQNLINGDRLLMYGKKMPFQRTQIYHIKECLIL